MDTQGLMTFTAETPNLYSPLDLAYLGDAVFELVVRAYLLKDGSRPVGGLSKQATGIVRASAQAAMYRSFEGILSDEEFAVMKRGRNAKSSTRAKNSSLIDYRLATGVEALIGYLYLKGHKDRITELIIGYLDGRRNDEAKEE